MAATRIKVVIDEAQLALVRNVLGSMRAPRVNTVMRAFLLSAAYAVQTDAARNQIIGGGGKSHAPPHPTRLTSRSGELRRSISANRGKDTSGLPRYIDVGSDLGYARLHEYGGTVTASSRSKGALKGAKSGLKRLGNRLGLGGLIGSHKAAYPPRPFLGPAVAAVSPRFELMLETELAKAVTKAAGGGA
jgi:phage gpG-like protein